MEGKDVMVDDLKWLPLIERAAMEEDDIGCTWSFYVGKQAVCVGPYS
jgi:hypothetical protein